MTEAEFRALKPGDTVREASGCGKTYTVTRAYDEGLDLVDTDGGHIFTRRLWDIVALSPASADSRHYVVTGVPEAWEVIEALQSSWPEDVRYHVGNVLKYVFRLGRKQGASVESDLEKIRNYADRAIKVLGKAK